MQAYWRFVERLLQRTVARSEAAAMVGDLHEDFVRRRAGGRLQALAWLLGETASVIRAYWNHSRVASVASPVRSRVMNLIHLDDVRIAARRLRHRPGASVASVLALASGIAAAATASSLLSAVLLKPLQVEEPGRLMVVGAAYAARGGGPGRTSVSHVYPTAGIIRETQAFRDVAAGGRWDLRIEEAGVRQLRSAYFATANFWSVLGVSTQHGRSFHADDDQRGASPVVVVSDRYWRRHLGADPAIVGRVLRIDDVACTVVGVAGAGFWGLSLAAEPPDVYLPLHIVGDFANRTTNFFADSSRPESPTAWITVLGRLKPESSAEQTAAQLNALPIEARRGATYELTDVNTAAVPEAVRAGMRGFGRLLGATVGLLLLVSGLTVGLLLLIRTEARRDEFAMCLALGASRLRIAAGIATEGALLSIAGGLAALPLAWWLFRALRAYQLPGGVVIDRLDLGLSPQTFVMSVAAAVAVTMLIALVAATSGFFANVADALRTRTGGTPRVSRRRTRSALVAAQVAVTLVLLAGATLFAKSLVAALRLNPGFDTTRIVSGSVSLFGHGYELEGADRFFTDLRNRLDREPAIRSASMGVSLGGMTTSGTVRIDGERRQLPSFLPYMAVDDRYFATIGMPILRGRNFTQDDTATAPLVVLVSESFGRLLANGGDPIGTRITESSSRIGQPPAVVTVVGVVPDVVTNVAVLEPLALYYALPQKAAGQSRTIVVRAAGDATAASAAAMAAIRAGDGRLAPAPFLTMEDRISRQMGPQSFGALVLGVLGAIAVLLTLLGTYVLAESMASMRRREVGIRAALGATRGSLSQLLLFETVRLVGFGIAAGLAMAWLGAETVRAFLYQVQPLDVTTLAGVSALILTLALAVSLRPVARASRVNLASVLREE